jgi:ribonuclease T2
MWPEDDDGSWPSTCTKERFNPSTVYDLGEDRFNRMWPNVKASANSKSHYSFWEHEWTKHGTCTSMTQDEYFDTALKHFLSTPSIVREKYGKTVARDELLEAYRTDQSDEYGDVILVCSGGKYLSEVRVCIGKNADGTGSKRIKCISQVAQEDTCGSEITLQKFYIDDDAMVEVK